MSRNRRRVTPERGEQEVGIHSAGNQVGRALEFGREVQSVHRVGLVRRSEILAVTGGEKIVLHEPDVVRNGRRFADVGDRHFDAGGSETACDVRAGPDCDFTYPGVPGEETGDGSPTCV